MEKEYSTSITELIQATFLQYTSEGLPFMAVVDECLSNKDLVTQIDRLYGLHLNKIAKRSPIERMVDEATGYSKDQLTTFVNIVYDLVWLRLEKVNLTQEQALEIIHSQIKE